MNIATSSPVLPSPAAVEFALLQSWLSASTTLQLPLHTIESQQSDKGRELQRLLLQTHLQQRGDGDIGAALLFQSGDQQLLYAHRRLGTRSLTTVFGSVKVERMGYSRPSLPSIFPLDQALCLPARSFSYELQRRLTKAAVQIPFLASVEMIAELTGVSVPKRSLEQILPDVAQDFDAFYRQRPPDAASGTLLVALLWFSVKMNAGSAGSGGFRPSGGDFQGIRDLSIRLGFESTGATNLRNSNGLHCREKSRQ